MTLSLYRFSNSRIVDSDGNPVAGAKLNFYTSGGSSFRQDTYNASDGLVGHKNANPVVADSGGLFGAIYFQPLAYYVELTTSGGTLIWSQDNEWTSDFTVLVDDQWILRDNADQTKKIQFQLSGITAGQTRTITAIDTDMEMGHAGEYTPTLTNTTNVAASTAYVTNYIRVGSYCHVEFTVDIDPTLAAPTSTEIQMSLPIASDFTLSTDASGTFGFAAVAGQGGAVNADVTTNKIRLIYIASNAANATAGGSFMYRIR